MLTGILHGVLIALAASAGAAGPGDAAAAAPEPALPLDVRTPPAGEPWAVSVTPYVWMFGIDGEIRVRNASVDVDLDFGDIWDNLDIALMARVEARQGRLGYYVDPLYGRLVSEVTAGSTALDVETELALVDGGISSRVLEERDERGRERIADLLLGARYVYIRNEIDFAMTADAAKSEDFVDLIIGARYGMDVTERFGFLLHGDIGGFDLGSSSEFSWSAQGLGSCRVGRSGRIWAGYRMLDIERDEGGASGFDVRFSGPVVGYEIRF